MGCRSNALLRLNPLTWLGFRVYSDRKTRRLSEEAGFVPEIRSPRPTERVAVGTKP